MWKYENLEVWKHKIIGIETWNYENRNLGVWKHEIRGNRNV